MPSARTSGGQARHSGARVVVTRPREDAESLVAALRARGHQPLIEPMLTIVPREAIDWPSGHEAAQALLITSANGLRAFARLDPRRLPVFAVGDASAAAARAAGFTEVASAAGTVEDLAALVRERLRPGDGPLFQPAASRLAGDLKGALESGGFRVLRAVLYDAEAATGLSKSLRDQLNSGLIDAVTFFSPRTAATFASLIGEAGLFKTCEKVAAVCLSGAVARQISGLPWDSVTVADRPDQAALLARLDALVTKGE